MSRNISKPSSTDWKARAVDAQSRLDILRREGGNAQKILDTVEELSHIRFEEGEFASAGDLFRELFTTLANLLGPRHVKTLDAQFFLGGSFYELGHYIESEIHFRGAADGSDKESGPQDTNTLKYRYWQARSLADLRRYEESEILQRQTWETKQRVLGQEAPVTLHSQFQVAWTLGRLKRYEESETLHRQTLKIRQRVLGQDDPNTLYSQNQLAWTLERLKRYEESETLHRQTWEIRQRVLGQEASDTLNSQHQLAWTLGRLKRYEESEVLYRHTWEVRQRVLGQEDPDTLLVLLDLSTTLFRLEKYHLALEKLLFLRPRSGILQRFCDRPVEITILGNMAECLLEVGRVEDAKEILKNVLLREDVETDLELQAHMELCLAIASADDPSSSSSLALEIDLAPLQTKGITFGKRALEILHTKIIGGDRTSVLLQDQASVHGSLSSHISDAASTTFLNRLLRRASPSITSVDTEITKIRETDRVPTTLELDIYFAKPHHTNFITRDAHLDTKASANYVSSEFIEHLGHSVDVAESGIVITAAGTISPIGQVSLVFEWQGLRKLRKRRFLVVDDLPFDSILGIGFISEFEVYSIGNCLLVMALSPLRKDEKEKLKIAAEQNRLRREAEEKIEEERNRSKRQEKALARQELQAAQRAGSNEEQEQ